MTALLFISLLILFVLGVPLAISLGLSVTISLLFGDTIPLRVIATGIFNSINSFTLMAIPFFILAGYLMETGGISKRLINLGSALVGHITGGLGLAAILTSMFFAALSGSGAATTAAVGSILIPAMIARGYDAKFSTANQAVAGAIGVIIPPSLPLIVYGIVAQQSIGDLFLAGILPGILVGVSLMITAYIIAKKRGYKGVEKKSFSEVVDALRKSLLSLLMPFIVLGGIYGGIFTPTEAAVVAVVYALIVGMVIYREIKISDLTGIFTKSAVTSAIVLSLIGTAGLFGYILNMLDIPGMISSIILGTTTSVVVFLVAVNIVLLIVGMFIESAAALLIFVPIFLPVALELGIDPIHFGIIMVVNLAMGMFTPPVGLNLFVASQISNVKIEQLVVPILPFVFVLFVDILILCIFPFLSTWLPSL